MSSAAQRPPPSADWQVADSQRVRGEHDERPGLESCRDFRRKVGEQQCSDIVGADDTWKLPQEDDRWLVGTGDREFTAEVTAVCSDDHESVCCGPGEHLRSLALAKPRSRTWCA